MVGLGEESTTVNILDKTDRSMHVVPPNSKAKPTKVESYKWTTDLGPRGVYFEIPKFDLNIDGSYQRGKVSDGKILEIARNWNWLIFGVLSVVLRPDRQFYVFDGGQRTRASFYRYDITVLPAMVHEFDDIPEEAVAFVRRARWLTSISAFERFKAEIRGEDALAVQCDEMVRSCGLKPASSQDSEESFCAIATLREIVSEDSKTAERVLAQCVKIRHGDCVSGIVIGGLFRLCKHFGGEVDVLRKFEDSLNNTTIKELEIDIRKWKAETGKGGHVSSAKAILGRLNHRKRCKLTWDKE